MIKIEVETKIQHVVPSDGRWGVRAENSEQPSKIFDLKMNAIAHAFDITQKYENGKVIVHREDGSFQNVNVTKETSKLMTILKS
ncbi:MAG: DUF2188 domain-containing protein [Candidatus Woesearchaeota archaeon]